MSSEYKVENDEYYKNFAVQSSRNEKTTDNYRKVLIKFCRATGKTLTDIITTCIDEQSIVTTIKLDPDENGNERKKEIKFNINSKDAAINKFLNQFEDHCFKRNNREITIENQTDMVRTFLHENGVELPKRKNYKDDSQDWYLPSKLDFNFFLQDASLVHASLANLLSSTGMRVSDALSLTIGDFMSATSDYHDFVDVEEFIDNAPDDMIGQWVFEPQKTRKHHVKCITFNSAHTSNMILQNLRHIKNHYIPYKNDADGLNLSISKKDPLFGSRKKKYKSPLNGRGVASYWIEKNKKFHVWKINQIKQQIEKGEISKEDYDGAVSRIPRLHPHVCRKFFSTVVSNNCGDIRVCALLEGHSDGLPNDKSYIKKSVEDIREIYINDIHDALSLDNVETKIISDKETERLNAEMESLRSENEDLKNQVKEMNESHQEEVAQLNIEMGDLRKEMKQNIGMLETYKEARNAAAEMSQIMPNAKLDFAIRKYYVDHHELGGRVLNLEERALCKLAYDEAIKQEDFEATEKHIETLFDIVEIRCSMNPDLLNKTIRVMRGVPDETLENIIDEISSWIISQPNLLKMAGGNPIRIQTVVQRYVLSNPEIEDEINNLSEKNKNNIIEDIMVECVKFNAQK